MDTQKYEPSEADARILLTGLEQCLLMHDAATKDILWANPAACRMFGFTLDELRPLKANDMSGLAEPYSRTIGRRWLQDAVEHGASRTQWMYRNKDGQDFLTEALARHVVLEEREVVLVEFRDVEREERLKSGLERTKGRLNAFIGNMGEAILVIGVDGRISYASNSLFPQLGLHPHEVIGLDFAGFCRGEAAQAFARASAECAQDDGMVTCRLELHGPAGESRWFGAACQRIDLKHDLAGTLVFLHDITERVREDRERERDQEHLNYLARYNVMGDMAMALSHELGQPLGAATNFLDGVQRRHQAGTMSVAELEFGLQNAQRQVERANQILRSLRGFVGTLETSEQHVDLNAVAQDCRYFIELVASRHSTTLEVALDPGELPVLCEKVLIGQVVLNLCRNAIEEMSGFPQEQRMVRLETAREGGFAVFRVIDHGSGLSGFPDGRIFDGAFTTKADGSGLGLALSHRIVTRHHGTITAEENPGGGSTFSFALPLT
ncbi:PAS domain-containing sensor histidine kinase [Paeniglutamicibacter cryotolerans]|uniref:histidine kinase n=1 Tax=Paeniglutamicibacter cryotolerans TaxID=670079 RepID=A0A839QNB7_9MICC|nr:ATP-binding protein [Paeniglutamicibacter cryotolerans]MBB2994712.1 PAS domain S-box-containing protein [Paeniglutamicibacter cryotolerans]